MPPDAAFATLGHVEFRLHQQELAAGFGLFALREDELQSVLDEACRIAAAGLGVHHAKLLRRDPKRGDFLAIVGVGWRSGMVGTVRLGPGCESPAGFCVEMGEAVVLGHLEERRFVVPPVLMKHGIRSAINVLIPSPVGDTKRCSDRFWGVLAVDSTGRDRSAKPDSTFLSLLAATLGACVERDARRADLRRLNDEREAERDLLGQEVHHRVKNSLQPVTALLSTQAWGSNVPAVCEQLLASAGCVATIGAVHERLYRDGSGEGADAAAYLAGLIADLRRSMSDGGAGRTVVLDVLPPLLQLPADGPTTHGLIATELVTNALKVGQGRVRLGIRPCPAGIEVACEDGRTGFPEGFNPRRSGGLGMHLVAALARGRTRCRWTAPCHTAMWSSPSPKDSDKGGNGNRMQELHVSGMFTDD